MKRSNNNSIEMLSGSIGDKILQFAVPLAATGILQQLFNAADVAIVGQFVGKEAMAAVGSNSPVIGLLVNCFMGIAIGVNVTIARFIGSRNPHFIRRSVHTAVAFAAAAGVVMTILGELIAAPMIHLLGVPDNIESMALIYIRIYFLGLPVIFLYNFESAIFRSVGDTRTPLICLIVAGVSNVALNLFFVIVVNMSVAGVALATVLSNLISSALLFTLLVRRTDSIRLHPKFLGIHGDVLKIMIRIGLPAGLQSMVFALSNLCIQSAINSLGSDVMAASAAAFNIEIIMFYILNAFGQACTTFVGQNYGAGNMKRCRRVTRISVIQDLIFVFAGSMLILYFGRVLLGLFNRDPVIASIGIIRLKYILGGEVINAFMEVLSGAMRGYGFSLVPALIALFGICGTRIAWVWFLFPSHRTFETLCAVYPLSWAVTAAVIVIAYLLFIRRVRAYNER